MTRSACRTWTKRRTGSKTRWRQGKTIFVHGDYDVDGVTSTAVYVRALTALGAKLEYRVPHRKRDGYDLKSGAIDFAREKGATLIITSDCGIQAREAVAYANSLGMTVIVTDHHEPGETLPPAYAVVNPHRHDSTYPFPHLAGVGVAFKTMQAVVRLVQPTHENAFVQKFLDLVACGTVADVMPLLGREPHFRVVWPETTRDDPQSRPARPAGRRGHQHGQAAVRRGGRLRIGPRINAVGRLDDAALALD